MKFPPPRTFAIVAALAVSLIAAATASAASTTATFAGTISQTMSVNNGTNTGTIPAGTPYTGTLTFDSGQTPAPVAYGGGTHTAYTFSNLAFTIGTSTANSGPGTIDVYDNLTSATGYPNGDSLYVNFGGVAPSGLLAGAAFNWMGLALLDPTGAAITAGTMPANLDAANFPTHFSEFNFGTRGQPWGAGNTSMIQTLTSLTTSGSQGSNPITFAPALADGTAGIAYSATFSPASGGAGSFTYAAAGLPPGLSLNGTTVSGTPTTPGTYTVTLTATDAASAAKSATVTVVIADQPITFNPSLPSGTVGHAYAASLSATGYGPFTFAASGLPPGLTLSGNTISGRPTARGTFAVTLTATDAAGRQASARVMLSVGAGRAGSGENEGEGRISSIDRAASSMRVGPRRLVWNRSTRITVHTRSGERHVIGRFVRRGMKVQWKGRLRPGSRTVIVRALEIN